MSWTKVLRVAVVLVLVLLVGWALGLFLVNRHLTSEPQDQASMPRATVSVGHHRLTVPVARTEAARSRGLAGVTSIPADGGMLFDAGTPARSAIWMMGMTVPIDIVWIEQGRVVHVVEGARPETVPHTTYQPDVPARYVLEVAAGTARRVGLHVGTAVTLRP